jgi:hypothetical protein
VQRPSLIAEIFGYLVCLFAVGIFFVSISGVVSNAFRVANPTSGPRIAIGAPVLRQHIAVPGGRGFQHGGGNVFFRAGGPPLPGPDVATARARFVGDARFDAVRRLVVAIVMLIVSILVFRRTFTWLNEGPRSTA